MDYRVDAQAAYVLHTRPYLETSAIIDFLTLENGRVSAVVKGVRRPNSKMRGVVQPFVPLHICWRGKQELKSLTLAESVGLNGILQGNALICGLYINELLQKLLSPFDPVPRLYVYYQYVLNELVSASDIEGALRTFERRLLTELGFGLPFDQIAADRMYRFDVASWTFTPVVEVVEHQRSRCFIGQDLLDIAEDSYTTSAIRQSAKRLMRLAIDHLLAGRPLNSRSLFKRM